MVCGMQVRISGSMKEAPRTTKHHSSGVPEAVDVLAYSLLLCGNIGLDFVGLCRLDVSYSCFIVNPVN